MLDYTTAPKGNLLIVFGAEPLDLTRLIYLTEIGISLASFGENELRVWKCRYIKCVVEFACEAVTREVGGR
jgi:hypothetical protein